MEPSDEQILHLWDTHVGYETGYKGAHLSNKDKVAFARAVLALSSTSAKAGDTVLLDFLREETLDLRCINQPTGGDDYEVRWRVIQHHMAEPQEREVGESFTDDPRDAIKDAMRKLATLSTDKGA